MKNKVLITRIVGLKSRKSLISILANAEFIKVSENDRVDLIPNRNMDTEEEEVLVSMNGFVIGKLPRLWCTCCNRRVKVGTIEGENYTCAECGPLKLEDASISKSVFDALCQDLKVSARILKYDDSDDHTKLGLEIEICQP